MSVFRQALPQLSEKIFLTDGGIETTLIYHEGLELPDFAAFVTARVRGLWANASTASHAELDAAEDLDIGDIEDLGARYARLRDALPRLTVLGGCCGTDARHIDAIRRACLA